jgi:hypothetical protein
MTNVTINQLPTASTIGAGATFPAFIDAVLQ